MLFICITFEIHNNSICEMITLWRIIVPLWWESNAERIPLTVWQSSIVSIWSFWIHCWSISRLAGICDAINNFPKKKNRGIANECRAIPLQWNRWRTTRSMPVNTDFGRWGIIKPVWHFWDYQLIVCRLNIIHSLPRLRVLKGLQCLNLYLFISLVWDFKWGIGINTSYCSFHLRLRWGKFVVSKTSE